MGFFRFESQSFLYLFITSDTAVAHLAGALEVPTWMALSTAPDWRWMTQREDCVWYPSMRIFRQTEPMTWGPVFERLATELRSLVPRDHPTRSVAVEVAPGELLDKITILEIKAAWITDSTKLTNIQAELAGLTDARHRTILESDALETLVAELRSVNESLWDIEDAIREREHADDFGPEFVRLARSVYQTNDHRAELKRQINVLLGSVILEEKSYVGPG